MIRPNARDHQQLSACLAIQGRRVTKYKDWAEQDNASGNRRLEQLDQKIDSVLQFIEFAYPDMPQMSRWSRTRLESSGAGLCVDPRLRP
jgi:hypothetical protein